jgi:hypothetical protein
MIEYPIQSCCWQIRAQASLTISFNFEEKYCLVTTEDNSEDEENEHSDEGHIETNEIGITDTTEQPVTVVPSQIKDGDAELPVVVKDKNGNIRYTPLTFKKKSQML